MKKIYRYSFCTSLTVLAFTTIASTAQAQDKACRLTQTITISGQKIVTDSCMQNISMDTTQFKKLCNDGSEGIPSLGIPPMNVVSLSSCPIKAVNTCTGFAQGRLTTYFYNNEDGPQRKQGCEATGGKFK